MQRLFAQTFSQTRLLAGTLAALWLCGLAAEAQDWTAPARQLADQLRRQIPPPARLSWSFQNRSTLSEEDLRAIRRAIASELRNAGYQARRPRASAGQVRISVSENFQSYLWIAQTLRSESKWVAMITVPRTPTAPPRNTSSLVIGRKLLFSREEPILDMAMISAPGEVVPRLLVLGRASLAVYERVRSAWQLAQTAPVLAARNWPRDLRGRLLARADGTFEASLPGERCLGSVNLLPNLDCHASDEPWPLDDAGQGNATAPFAADRNYFSGPVAVPDNQPLPVPEFYSAVPLQAGKDSLWLVATTDGQVRIVGPREDAVEFQGWGSELAAMRSTCGTGTLVFATRSSDFAAPDSVQAFQIRNRAAEAASAPVEFRGPVTLLHASSEEGVAFAAAQDLSTGLHEAYRLSINCSE
jgi:hypothetical protein